jgi:hypothetical protein
VDKTSTKVKNRKPTGKIVGASKPVEKKIDGRTLNSGTQIKNRVGETNTIHGELATIINYNGAMDIDIQFEDGTIVKHRQYDSFKKGHIIKDRAKIKKSLEALRLGEESIVRGEKARIVGYRNCLDIDVQFPDGTVYEHTTYRQFKTGRMSKIKQSKENDYKWHIGEERRIKGHKVRVIEYRNTFSIDLIVDNKYVLKNQRYDYFIEGRISEDKLNSAMQSNK